MIIYWTPPVLSGLKRQARICQYCFNLSVQKMYKQCTSHFFGPTLRSWCSSSLILMHRTVLLNNKRKARICQATGFLAPTCCVPAKQYLSQTNSSHWQVVVPYSYNGAENGSNVKEFSRSNPFVNLLSFHYKCHKARRSVQ